VDATYRADLRDINELNFARFDAKLEQRMGALDAKLEQRMGALEAKLEQRTGALEVKLEQRMAAVEAQLEIRLAETKSDLIKWMFAFLAPTFLIVLGLGIGVFAVLLNR
jgi:hypothetical protein